MYIGVLCVVLQTKVGVGVLCMYIGVYRCAGCSSPDKHGFGCVVCVYVGVLYMVL